MKNKEIYQIATKLIEAFNQEDNKYYPPRFNYYLQKNIKIFYEFGVEFELEKNNILKQYGKINPDNQQEFILNKGNEEIANKELQDFLNSEQDINFYKIKYSVLEEDSISLTASQMQAILFMIEDDFDQGE